MESGLPGCVMEEPLGDLKAWFSNELQRGNAALAEQFEAIIERHIGGPVGGPRLAGHGSSSPGLSPGMAPGVAHHFSLPGVLSPPSSARPSKLDSPTGKPQTMEEELSPRPPSAVPATAWQGVRKSVTENSKQAQRRGSGALRGATYQRLIPRVHIDFKESVVDAFASFLVILYTFILLLQTQWRGLEAAQRLEGVKPGDPGYEDWPGAEVAFLIVDHIFNAIFVVELAWRLYMHRMQFLCDIFGVFDVLVVIATSIDVYVLQPFDAAVGQNFAVGRLIRIFRLMRIFRVLRVMRFAKNMQQLRILGEVLSKCFSPLLWALLVLGIIMVGTGVLMSQLLVEFIVDDSQDQAERQWVS